VCALRNRYFKSEIWLCHLANCTLVGHGLYMQFIRPFRSSPFCGSGSGFRDKPCSDPCRRSRLPVSHVTLVLHASNTKNDQESYQFLLALRLFVLLFLGKNCNTSVTRPGLVSCCSLRTRLKTAYGISGMRSSRMGINFVPNPHTTLHTILFFLNGLWPGQPTPWQDCGAESFQESDGNTSPMTLVRICWY